MVAPDVISPHKFIGTSHSHYFCNNCHTELINRHNKYFIVEGDDGGAKMDAVTKSKMFEQMKKLFLTEIEFHREN